MIFVALNDAAQRGELILVDGGMCRFHLRRDGVCTIHEIIVEPKLRRLGIGRRLLAEVCFRCPGAMLRASCPADYDSNGFWRHMGFVRVSGTEKINLWQSSSFIVPPVTPNSPA